jgi:hypothetical protein
MNATITKHRKNLCRAYTAFGIAVFLIIMARACFGAEPSGDWWSSVSVSPYGAATHKDLGRPTYGAGLDVGYYVNRTVSLHLAALANEPDSWRGAVIDETSFLFRADLIRSSKERFVAYFIGSGDRAWGRDDWGFGAGVGAEVRLTKNISAGADARLRAWFDTPKDVQTRVYTSFRF